MLFRRPESLSSGCQDIDGRLQQGELELSLSVGLRHLKLAAGIIFDGNGGVWNYRARGVHHGACDFASHRRLRNRWSYRKTDGK
jgi:hypothetical protein